MKSSVAGRFGNLIPLPQSIHIRPLTFATPTWQVCCENTDPRIRASLQRLLPRGWKQVESPREANLLLIAREHASIPDSLSPPIRKEAYRLEITPRQVQLWSGEARGLFYGLQTLSQLLTQSHSLPCGVIVDWPDLEMRGMHLTLGNGHMPTYDRLREIIRQLAHFKFNNLHLEYDASFQWERYPFIAIPSALTKDQCRSLIALAEENFLELIPTIDSLGHQELYLCHKELQHLRELPNSNAELCASNPKSKIFIQNLWREVLEVHHNARHVNITGDEVFRLGRQCPRCQKRTRLGHQADLFFDYYGELSRWMLERGHRPMMWHDMLASHPERLRDYPRELMILYWNYWGTDARKWEVTHGLPSDLPHGDIATLSPQLRKLYSRYWLHPLTAPHFTPWPYLRFFAERGFDTLGASSGSPVLEEFPFAGFASRIKNAKSMAAGVKAAGGKGLLHTHWGSFASIETAWTDIAAAGDYAWKSREEATESFLHRYEAQCLGTGGRFVPVAKQYDQLIYPDTPAEFHVSERLPTVAQLQTLQKKWTSLQATCPRHTTLFDALAPSFDLANVQLTAIRHSIDHLRPQLGNGRDEPLDLSAAFNGRTQRILPGMTGSCLNMKPGRHTALGISLKIADGRQGRYNALILQGDKNPQGPRHIELPLANKNYDRLFFFHTSAYGGKGEEIARYQIEFANGGIDSLPVIVGHNIGDWFQGEQILPAALVAWQGFSNTHDRGRRMLYVSWWKNATPSRPIRRITLTTSQTGGHVTLVAITGRRLQGSQPAPSRQNDDLITQKMEQQARRFEAHYRDIYRKFCVLEHIPLALQKLNAARYRP
ncbi:MAG: hypothetical protein B9S32_04370 [Verrucomicrobia bacterium Tous-C9LFEB]|nr:MAG: hypothetical protein B9S32_04370 [Verrucomicrobia bacterium Tous-C9LFEB]